MIIRKRTLLSKVLKRFVLALVALVSFVLGGFELSAQEVQQDSANTGGTLYLPGMPLPPQQESPSGVKAEKQASQSQGQGGKISRVSMAGEIASKRVQREMIDPAQPLRYKGVVPPSQDRAPNRDELVKSNVNSFIWLGFQKRECRDIVFIQTAQKARYQKLDSSDNVIKILLKNVELTNKNTSRRLDMSYFESAFRYAIAKRRGKDVIVSIELNKPVSCDIQTFQYNERDYFVEISHLKSDCVK